MDKLVVYGAGEYGRRLIFHLGKENIVAFIDLDEKKIGTSIEGIKVISIDEYQEKYSDILVVIAFAKQRLGEEELNKRGIYSYLRLLDCPGEYMEANDRNLQKKYVIESLDVNLSYGIYGCTLYSLLVYDWIKVKTQKLAPIFVDTKTERQTLLNFLKEKGYPIYDINEWKQYKINKILNTNMINDLLEKGLETDIIEDIFDCSDKIEEYYNPLIEQFKNCHEGEKCVIVATGPSLRIEDLDRLKELNVPTISMNTIFYVFEKTEWRPYYYMAYDTAIHRKYADEVEKMDAKTLFISDADESYWEINHKKNILKFHCNYFNSEDVLPHFSDDLSRRSYSGMTITYLCIQLAVYMGFKEIFLLGVDFSYAEDGKKYEHFYKEEKLVATGFNNQVLLAYQSAKKYADEHGIKIYNATRGGKLEVFERVNFDDLF